MIYQGKVKVHTERDGNILLIGVDGTTFISTFGYGDEARQLAQHLANLWNKSIGVNEL